jgi:hypothetical protein
MIVGTAEHPKTLALQNALGLSNRATVGTLNILWDFAYRYAERGDVGRFTDMAIESQCGWGVSSREKPGDLVCALVKCGFLDPSEEHRLVIHNYAGRCPEFIKKRLKRKGLEAVRTKRPPAPPLLSAKKVSPGGEGRGREGKGTTKKATMCLCPEAFTKDDLDRLFSWSKQEFGLSPDQTGAAIRVVRDWSLSGDKKRLDWVATIRNAIREGWALRSSKASDIPKGNAYRDASDVMAEAKEKQRLTDLSHSGVSPTTGEPPSGAQSRGGAHGRPQN